MKVHKLCISTLACLAVLSGCGEEAGVSGESSAPTASELGELAAADSKATEAEASAPSAVGESPVPESGDNAVLSEEVQAAYAAFRAGDISLFGSEDLARWGLESWEDIFLLTGGLEYACLDLDGDGIEELLIQYADAPSSCNGVFHYDDGRLFCWQFDCMEGNCRDYPLRDGTMVRQYDTGGGSSYTLFRYKNDGETEEISSLFIREELTDPNSDSPCPYYEVDNTEVDEAAFHQQLKDLVTDQMLERSSWTAF